MIQTKERMLAMSPEKLWKNIQMQQFALTKLRNSVLQRESLIRHLNRRIKKIRDSLDYLLEHNYSEDTGNKTNKHSRDIPKGQPIFKE